MRGRLTRRQFLSGAVGAGAALVAACGTSGPVGSSTPAASSARPSPSTSAVPSVPPAPTPSPSLPLRRRIGALLVVGFRGLTVGPDDPIVRAIRDDGLGGVILFDRDQDTSEPRNIASPDQLRALTDALRTAAGGRPFLIAVDQEGGRVERLGPQDGFPSTPSEAEIGALGDPEAARRLGGATATTLDAMGLNLNLAPVVDLNVNPDNPSIGALDRSFSADPAVVTELAGAVIAGHHDHGVLTTLKHFPGLGSATGNTDLGFVDISATWSGVELEPFRRLVAAALPDAIMVANALNRQIDAEMPASLSAPTIDLLRTGLGWGGVVMTDDLQAGALRSKFDPDEIVELALTAGNDVLLLANQQVHDADAASRTIDVIAGLVERGVIEEGRIDESVARVSRMVARQAAAGQGVSVSS